MSYTLQLTPYLAGILSAACLAAGLDPAAALAVRANRLTAAAEAEPAAATAAAPAAPAPGSSTPAAAKLRTLNLPPVSLTAPGDILLATDDLAWDDPSLYQ